MGVFTIKTGRLAALGLGLLVTVGCEPLRYGDSLAGTAGMLGIDVGLAAPRVSARGTMALSQFATGEWAWQGSGRAVLAHPLQRTIALRFSRAVRSTISKVGASRASGSPAAS